MTCSDDYDESLEFKSDLETLEIRVSLIEFIAFALCLSLSLSHTHTLTQIREAIELIEKDTSMFGTTNHAEVSISQVG
jgi:hypothetical protein